MWQYHLIYVCGVQNAKIIFNCGHSYQRKKLFYSQMYKCALSEVNYKTNLKCLIKY